MGPFTILSDSKAVLGRFWPLGASIFFSPFWGRARAREGACGGVAVVSYLYMDP
jgi:hypothetical protein